MTIENYYLAVYDAITTKNLTKAIELNKIPDDEEGANYNEELPWLNFEEIFKDQNPKRFLISLVKTEEYKDFVLKIWSPLATEENIAIREKNHLLLMEHPLINYSPSLYYNISPVEALLSMSYSEIFKTQDVRNTLLKLVAKSPIINDVLSVVAASINNSSRSFSISLLGDEIEEHDPTIESGVGGENDNLFNRLIVENENLTLNKEFIIHELTHKAMDLMFDNDMSPYNDDYTKDKYKLAIKNTLLNIQKFIKQEFGLDVQFKNQDDTWEMGKTLSTILFPQYLSNENIREFTQIFEQYNLSVSDKFSWLAGHSPLGTMLLFAKLELADALVEMGANIDPMFLHNAAYSSNMELLNWFLENKNEADINLKNCYGNAALDYADHPQIIKLLISVGAIAYPPSYEETCPNTEYNLIQCSDDENSTQEQQLNALEKLLNFYSQNDLYDKDEESAEFIARFPQIIVSELYEGPIVEIFEPMEKYWQEEVFPAAAQYQLQHLVGDVCFMDAKEYPFLESF